MTDCSQENYQVVEKCDVCKCDREGTMHHAPDAMGWATPVLWVCGYCDSPPFFVNLYRETKRLALRGKLKLKWVFASKEAKAKRAATRARIDAARSRMKGA